MKNLIQALHIWLATLQTVRSFHPLPPLIHGASSRDDHAPPRLPSASLTFSARMRWSRSSSSSHLMMTTTTAATATDHRPPCFYKSPSTGTWKERVALEDIEVGDELTDCQIVQELYRAKTGPKVFCDCGVGRFVSSNRKWKIVNAMLRLDRKESVARKRAARLRKKKCFSAHVSRIRLDNQQLEICLSLEDVPKGSPKKISASQLTVGQELIGKVVRVEPFGVLVDVGANRNGLLHIQNVANLYGHYIDKAKGLVFAGLERDARIRLQVASIDRQRLFLDFTQDAKDEAAMSHERSTKSAENSVQQSNKATVQLTPEPKISAATSDAKVLDAEDEYDNEEDDNDEYDEDRDIEDALGLGTY